MELPTPDQVRVIITTSLDDEAIEAMISDASAMARRCLTRLDPDVQTTVVKWLAAHLIASRTDLADSALVSSKLGDAQETYMRAQLGQNILGTPYGQQAAMLDPFGCIAGLGKRRPIIEVI